MVMYPTVTMPADNDFHQNLPSVSEVLTSMASGVIASDSERFTGSEELMDISKWLHHQCCTSHNTACDTNVCDNAYHISREWLVGSTEQQLTRRLRTAASVIIKRHVRHSN
ncbi:hypothetical protein BSL78_02080 [Apostichopus japonicus]|uniref:Uncharacterized protein n=1 Tax=Stichopus japonicus TaxID=307972 RepID=A0A2G8LKW7_STIJA|nr:hypothetical protein BSL78_02080 [Apostichopus japonicus]